jgi:TctA family transporter
VAAKVKARSVAERLSAFLPTGDKGQATVEAALTMMFLMLPLLIGMFSICIAILSYQQMSVAVSNAAQYQLALARMVSPDPCAAIATSVTNSLPAPGWTAANFTYIATIQNSTGGTVTYGPTAGSGFSCTAAATVLSADGPNTTGTLTVSYPYTWIPVYLQHMTGTIRAFTAVNVN